MIFVLFALMLQLRRRRDIADRSLGDFQIKVAFLSKFYQVAVGPPGFYEKRYMSYGDLLATFMRCRDGIADR